MDHVEEYRLPKEFEESESDNEKVQNDYIKDRYNIDKGDKDKLIGNKREYKLTGPDGKGWGKDRILSEEDKLMFENIRKEEIRNENKMRKRVVDENCLLELNEEFDIEEKPMWEKRFLEMVNREKERINKKYEKKQKQKNKIED